MGRINVRSAVAAGMQAASLGNEAGLTQFYGKHAITSILDHQAPNVCVLFKTDCHAKDMVEASASLIIISCHKTRTTDYNLVVITQNVSNSPWSLIQVFEGRTPPENSSPAPNGGSRVRVGHKNKPTPQDFFPGIDFSKRHLWFHPGPVNSSLVVMCRRLFP